MKGKPKPLAIRKYLVSVYVKQGYKAAAPLAIKYGYAPRYLYSMARQILGHYKKISYRRNPFVEFESYRFDPRFTVRTTNDPDIRLHRRAPHSALIVDAADPPRQGAGQE